jgi:hypothetical protein
MRLPPKAAIKVAIALGVASLFAAVPSGVASTNVQSQAAAPGGEVKFRFTFDLGETLQAGTRVRDASGNGRFGVVRVSGGGRLTVVRTGNPGRAAGFPRVCVGCGRGIITVANAPALNPGTRPFSFGASVRATNRQTPVGADPNIVGKGTSGSAGGTWKLHLLGAKPRCVFEGAASRVAVTSKVRIDDGTWHRVICSRNGIVHTLTVDGVPMDSSTTVFSGKTLSTDPVKIGGRAAAPSGSNDQFHGDLDGVFLRINNP